MFKDMDWKYTYQIWSYYEGRVEVWGFFYTAYFLENKLAKVGFVSVTLVSTLLLRILDKNFNVKTYSPKLYLVLFMHRCASLHEFICTMCL